MCCFFTCFKCHPFESELPDLTTMIFFYFRSPGKMGKERPSCPAWTTSQDRTWLPSRPKRHRSQGQKLVGGFQYLFFFSLPSDQCPPMDSQFWPGYGSTRSNDDGWLDFPLYWLLLVSMHIAHSSYDSLYPSGWCRGSQDCGEPRQFWTMWSRSLDSSLSGSVLFKFAMCSHHPFSLIPPVKDTKDFFADPIRTFRAFHWEGIRVGRCHWPLATCCQITADLSWSIIILPIAAIFWGIIGITIISFFRQTHLLLIRRRTGLLSPAAWTFRPVSQMRLPPRPTGRDFRSKKDTWLYFIGAYWCNP